MKQARHISHHAIMRYRERVERVPAEAARQRLTVILATARRDHARGRSPIVVRLRVDRAGRVHPCYYLRAVAESGRSFWLATDRRAGAVFTILTPEQFKNLRRADG